MTWTTRKLRNTTQDKCVACDPIEWQALHNSSICPASVQISIVSGLAEAPYVPPGRLCEHDCNADKTSEPLRPTVLALCSVGSA
jgi:hypothetical protein